MGKILDGVLAMVLGRRVWATTERTNAVIRDWKCGYTDEEIADAEVIYRAEVEQMYKDGYAGDFGSGLQFAMTTYGPMCWQHYFKRAPTA